MMIKGSLLALVIASVYAQNKPNGGNGGGGGGGGGGSNPNPNGARTGASGPYNAGGYSRSGNGRPISLSSGSGNGRPTSSYSSSRYGNPTSSSSSRYGNPNYTSGGSRWGYRRRRRRNPRPANWVRPAESNGDDYEDTASWLEDGYDKCDAKLHATCCELPVGLSIQDKKDICYAVGCDYDKCDWSDDGWSGDTLKPTSKPSWAADGWQKDGWNDDGHNVCLAVDQDMCCNLPQSISTYKKQLLCDKVGCDYDKCNWKDDGWKGDTHKPTEAPTQKPTSVPTARPTAWEDDGYTTCDVQSRDICCNQSSRLSVDNKKMVCEKLHCMYEKCGWKRDGYDNTDSEPAWKNDGYNKDYDDKYDNKSDNTYDVDYTHVKDRYDEQWNSYKDKNYGGDNNYQDSNYDHVNDYDDDKCTADERRECCTVDEKIQKQVCGLLGCSINKCDKRDWDDDGYDANRSNKIPTSRPTWRNIPYYMDGYNNRPTFRPTYRRSYSTGQYDPYAPPTIGTYAQPTPYNPYAPTTPYNPYAPPTPYNPYAPPTPYSPNNPYSPPTWQGDSYKGAEPSPWKGDAYKKYKTNKPTASPTQSSAPTKSPRPSMTPSVSSAPSVSSKPSKANKPPPGTYGISYTKKYEQDMKVMREDLNELKELLQMSLVKSDGKDDIATEDAYAETKQLKDEIEKLKVLIAESYVQDEVDDEDTDYLEAALSEVEAEVIVVEKVIEEKVMLENVDKAEAEATEIEVEMVLEEKNVKNETAKAVEVVETEKPGKPEKKTAEAVEVVETEKPGPEKKKGE